MEIIKGQTSIDFIGKRRVALFMSSVINISIVVGIAIFGFNFGVDFAGGTLVEVKFPYAIDAAQVREAAHKGGLPEPQVQSIGSASENSFLLRMGGVTQLTAEGGDSGCVVVGAGVAFGSDCARPVHEKPMIVAERKLATVLAKERRI